MISTQDFNSIVSLADLSKVFGEVNALSSVSSNWLLFLGIGILLLLILNLFKIN